MSEEKIDPLVVKFHELAVEVIYAGHNDPALSLHDLQWIRADARAAYLAADRRVVERGGQSMETGT